MGQGRTVEDLMRASPCPVECPPEEQPVRLLRALYNPEEAIFCGGRRDRGKPGTNINTVGAWIDMFSSGRQIPPHIIPNPLTGEEALTKAGNKRTYRGDRCVASHRFAVVEFDNLSLDEQIAFWWALMQPVAALIYSGGKSIHGWVRVGQDNAEDWDLNVRDLLFGGYLVPMGVDGACSNPARLSRLPGHRRGDSWQQLIYLNPKGSPVHV